MRWKMVAVGLLTIVCLVWVLWGVDFSSMAGHVVGFSWWVVIPGWGLYALAHWVRCFRLRALLGVELSTPRLYSITAIGFLAINVVPLRLGEFVRPYMLLQDGVAFGRSMAAVFVERLLDLLSLGAMLFAITLFVAFPEGGVQIGGIDIVSAAQRLTAVIVALGLLFGFGIIFAGAPVIAALGRAVGAFSAPTGAALGGFLEAFREGFRSLFASPRRAMAVVFHSAAIWLIVVTAIWIFLLGATELDARWSMGLTSWTLTLAGITVAPTPGFFGAYELFFSGALQLFAVDKALAVSVALIVHLTQFIFGAILGVFFLAYEGLSLRAVVDASRAAASDQSADSVVP